MPSIPGPRRALPPPAATDARAWSLRHRPYTGSPRMLARTHAVSGLNDVEKPPTALKFSHRSRPAQSIVHPYCDSTSSEPSVFGGTRTCSTANARPWRTGMRAPGRSGIRHCPPADHVEQKSLFCEQWRISGVTYRGSQFGPPVRSNQTGRPCFSVCCLPKGLLPEVPAASFQDPRLTY